MKQLVERLHISRLEIKQRNQREMDVAVQEKKAVETEFARRIASLDKELNQERMEKS